MAIELDAIISDILATADTAKAKTTMANTAKVRKTRSTATAEQTVTTSVAEPTTKTTDPFEGYWLSDALTLHRKLCKVHPVPTLLVGYPGTGKSDYAARLAEELGLPLVRIACGAIVESTDWFAIRSVKDGSTGWELTPLGSYMQQDQPALVLLDEISRAAPGTANALLPLLDGQGQVTVGDQTFKVPAGTVWIATGNPPRQDDRDVRGIGSALLNRFATVELGFPPEQEEARLLQARGCTTEVAWRVARWANLTRQSTVVKPVSTRQAITVATIATTLATAGLDPADAIQLVAGAWSGATPGGRISEREEVCRLWQGVW